MNNCLNVKAGINSAHWVKWLAGIVVFLSINLSVSGQDTARIYVALWDSPAAEDLYCGKKYGINTFFENDPDWYKVESNTGSGPIKEKVIFYNREKDIYMEAFAYHSDSITSAIKEFISAAYIAPKEELLIYVGHDGLMDFYPNLKPSTNKCDVMVFSCVSDRYFSPYLNMKLSTYTFMAPEAYAVMAAIEAWADRADETEIRKSAARAYAQYQRITESQAESTFLNQ